MDKDNTLREFLSTLLDDKIIYIVTVDFDQYSITLFPGILLYSLPDAILERKVIDVSIGDNHSILIKCKEN